MSTNSIEKYSRQHVDNAATIRLVTDIALGTVLDPDLHRAVLARPWCVDAIARQVLYFAIVASAVKHDALEQPEAARSIAFSHLVSTPLQTNVVVIGLGNVGSAIVDLLLKSQQFHPTAITIVTRHDKFPSRFEAAGVRCYSDAAECISDADVIVFACQPGQFAAAAKTVREANLRKGCVAMCVCAGISADKAAAELGKAHCVATDIDASRLAKLAEMRELQLQTNARNKRLDFASVKVPGMTPTAPPPHSDTGDSAAQRREYAHSCFFANAPDFVNRCLHALVAAALARGAKPAEAVRSVAAVLLPAEALLHRHSSSATAATVVGDICNLEELQELCGGTSVRDILDLIEERFVALVGV
jgi:hypothetical protein